MSGKDNYQRAIQIVQNHRRAVLRAWFNHGRRKRGFSAFQRWAYAYLNGVETYNTQCEHCITTVKKTELHHIDGNFLNNQLSNLMFLCHRCHLHAHHLLRTQGVYMSKRKIKKRQFWTEEEKKQYVREVRMLRDTQEMTIKDAVKEVGFKWGFTSHYTCENFYYDNKDLVPEETLDQSSAKRVQKNKKSNNGMTKITVSQLDVLQHIAVLCGMQAAMDVYTEHHTGVLIRV